MEYQIEENLSLYKPYGNFLLHAAIFVDKRGELSCAITLLHRAASETGYILSDQSCPRKSIMGQVFSQAWGEPFSITDEDIVFAYRQKTCFFTFPLEEIPLLQTSVPSVAEHELTAFVNRKIMLIKQEIDAVVLWQEKIAALQSNVLFSSKIGEMCVNL